MITSPLIMASISTHRAGMVPRQVIRLFQNLIAPFGEGHEYTWCAMGGVSEKLVSHKRE